MISHRTGTGTHPGFTPARNALGLPVVINWKLKEWVSFLPTASQIQRFCHSFCQKDHFPDSRMNGEWTDGFQRFNRNPKKGQAFCFSCFYFLDKFSHQSQSNKQTTGNRGETKQNKTKQNKTKQKKLGKYKQGKEKVWRNENSNTRLFCINPLWSIFSQEWNLKSVQILVGCIIGFVPVEYFVLDCCGFDGWRLDRSSKKALTSWRWWGWYQNQG